MNMSQIKKRNNEIKKQKKDAKIKAKQSAEKMAAWKALPQDQWSDARKKYLNPTEELSVEGTPATN